jgi:hypothetical protein
VARGAGKVHEIERHPAAGYLDHARMKRDCYKEDLLGAHPELILFFFVFRSRCILTPIEP